MASQATKAQYYLQRAQERIAQLEAIIEAIDGLWAGEPKEPDELDIPLSEAVKRILIKKGHPAFADAVFDMSEDEADAVLREYGYDPEQIGKRGREIAEEALSKARIAFGNADSNE